METKHFIVVIILLSLSFVGVRFFSGIKELESAGLTPERFPAEFSGWIGKDVPVTDAERNFLPEDTLFVKKVYTHADVGEVFLVVVFSGSDRRSIHRPEVCYPSQGWSIQNKSTESVVIEHPLKQLDTTRLDVNYVREKYNYSDVVLYWFMGNKRVTASHFKRVMLIGFDRCVLGRDYRWAFVRASSVVTSAGKEASLGVLKRFSSDLFPYIADDDYAQY